MEPLTITFGHTLGLTNEELRTITITGVLRTEADGLVLEFRREEDNGYSETRVGEIRTVHIPWAEIQSITYKRGWIFGGRLTVRTRSLRALAEVPFAFANEFFIVLTRAERRDARELAANVTLAVAEHRLKALEAPDLPPALPPG